MKNTLSLLLILLTMISCSTSESKKENLYEGELFIKLIRIGSDIFSVEDENGETLAEKFSSLKDETSLNEEDKSLKEHFDLLNDNDLIGKPYFHVKSSKTSVEYETVYISEEEFKKVSDFKLSELQKNNQKVIIEFYGSPISDFAIKSKKIKSVKLVDGITEWKK